MNAINVDMIRATAFREEKFIANRNIVKPHDHIKYSARQKENETLSDDLNDR